MNILFRNFFYAVAFVLLAGLYSLNPIEAQFGDLARLVQSPYAQKLAAVLTVLFVGVDIFLSAGNRKEGALCKVASKDSLRSPDSVTSKP